MEKEILAYCVKCRKKTPLKDYSSVFMKSGRPALKGQCSVCGTGVFLIVPKEKA